MRNAIKVLIVLLVVLLAAAGVAWYTLGHGGQQAGNTSTDVTAARQVLSDIKANSTLKFSVAVPQKFDWYIGTEQGNPQQTTLSGVAMVAKAATSAEAEQIDTWLQQQGFTGNSENTNFGDTAVSEGYTKGSVAVIVVTPVSSEGTAQTVTQLKVYAGTLPQSATPSSPSN